MRSSLIYLALLAGCTGQASPFGTLFTLPVNAVTSASENAIYTQRRGEVELIVKSDFDGIITDIQTGGGDTLTAAFDAAGVPDTERATRAFQLNTDIALYANNPGALVTAIMVYSSA